MQIKHLHSVLLNAKIHPFWNGGIRGRFFSLNYLLSLINLLIFSVWRSIIAAIELS